MTTTHVFLDLAMGDKDKYLQESEKVGVCLFAKIMSSFLYSLYLTYPRKYVIHPVGKIL